MNGRYTYLEPLSALKSRVKRPPQPHTEAPKPVVEGTYKLHGSCLIFTPVFVQRFDEPFDPGTFLNATAGSPQWHGP